MGVRVQIPPSAPIEKVSVAIKKLIATLFLGFWWWREDCGRGKGSNDF